MTDAPERIYAWVYRDGDRMLASCICAVSPCGPFQTEYVRADLEATASPSTATPLDDPRVKALVEAVRHEREMVCQDFDMQSAAARAVDAALSALEENK